MASCTGMVVVSRAIGATIKTDGKSYKGTYIGSSTGPAGLSGKRSGNALNLGIRWAKDVNGDRSAKLRLEKVGDNGMRLTTVDTDPATGQERGHQRDQPAPLVRASGCEGART